MSGYASVARTARMGSRNSNGRDYTYRVPLWMDTSGETICTVHLDHTHNKLSLFILSGEKQVLYILPTPITSYPLGTGRYHPSHPLWTISSCQVSSFPSVPIPSSHHPMLMPISSILHPTTVHRSSPPSYRQSTHHPLSAYPCQQLPNSQIPNSTSTISTPP